MELLLNSFITHQILEPVFLSGFRNNSLKIKHIGIFERGKEFGSKLKNNMLIFFPEDISFREVEGLHLEERDCSAVFYKNSMALREMEEVHFPVLPDEASNFQVERDLKYLAFWQANCVNPNVIHRPEFV